MASAEDHHAALSPDHGSKIPAVSAVQNAVALIRQALIDGRFRPAERLTVAQLSRDFNIGAMPVREALRQLDGEGIVCILPNRGAVVRALNQAFLEDLYEVRTALQEIALRRAIPRLTLERLRYLELVCRDQERAARDNDEDAALANNRRFHMAIFEIAGNAHAIRIFQRDWELVHSLRLRFGYRPGRIRQIAEEQWMLVDALRNDEVEAATATMRLHNRAGLEDILMALQDT